MRLKSFILKQYNIGAGVGAFNTLWGKSFMYVGIMTTVFSTITVWEVSIKAYLLQYIPWFSFPLFLMVIVIGMGLAMLLVYKFSIQSDIRFGMWQGWLKDNPVRTEFEKIEAKQSEIETKLDRIMEILKGVN